MALGTRLSSTVCYGVALLTISACSDSSDAERPANVSAEVSENISTVVSVRWHTEQASIGYVEYGPSPALGFNTPLEDTETKEHSYNLLGLTAETKYYYRVVTWDGRDAGASAVATFTTGALPLGVPRLTRKGDANDLFTIVPILGSTTAVTILNPQGEVVWYHTDDRDLDFYRARLSLNGKDLIYNAASISGDPAENSELVRVSLDGASTSSIQVPLLAHDFVEHPDGTLAAMVVEYRDFEGKQLRGDKIVEIDPEGNQTTIWTSWDCFDPAVAPGDDIELGWTFANALDYDASEKKYYLGMRNFSSIAKIDRATHACDWVLGTTAPTIEFAPGSAQFLHQHQFQVRGNRIVVFDNDGSLGDESRVLEYELDFEANRATQIWSYVSNPTVHTFVLGEPTRLANGDTFIDWGTAGQLERVNAAGESIWKVNSGAGTVFGFNTLAPTLYSATAKNP
jgi:hypothetical protein